MKLVSYREQVANLGDSLQTLALNDFIKRNKDKYGIDINGYCRRSELKLDTRDMIVNGWHRHHRNKGERLPEYAMFIGLHSEKDMLRYINKDCLVGCRDSFTLNELSKLPETSRPKGILSYCATLTIPTYTGSRHGSLKLFHTDKDTSCFNISVEKQFKKANDMLDMIKQSEIVYTDRLHVCLPAIAVGTPVVLNPRVYQPERYSIFDTVPMFPGVNKIIDNSTGIKEYMETAFEDAFLKVKENYDMLKI